MQFNSQVREKRANLSASIPFEYCYALSRGQTEVLMPEVSLTTRGGAVFPVTRPFVIVAGETTDGQVHAVGYCLAVFKSDIPIDIIGRTSGLFLNHGPLIWLLHKKRKKAHDLDCSCTVLTDEHSCAENFMTGLKVVFDRQRSVLGWTKFDCKKINQVSSSKFEEANNITLLN